MFGCIELGIELENLELGVYFCCLDVLCIGPGIGPSIPRVGYQPSKEHASRFQGLELGNARKQRSHLILAWGDALPPSTFVPPPPFLRAPRRRRPKQVRHHLLLFPGLLLPILPFPWPPVRAPSPRRREARARARLLLAAREPAPLPQPLHARAPARAPASLARCSNSLARAPSTSLLARCR